MRLRKLIIFSSLLFLDLFLNAKPPVKRKVAPVKVAAKVNYRSIKDKKDYNNFIKNGSGIHAVKFYATWCGACTQIKDMYNKLADKYKNQVHFSVIDIDKDDLKSLLSDHKVVSVPTIIFFKDGKEIARERGAMGESELDDRIKKIIKDSYEKKG